MGAEQEAAVRAFMAEMEGEQQDAAQVERVVNRMASDARYQIFAWDDPLVGRDAIRAELLRQAPVWRDLRIEILTIGSVGHIVFTERLDSMVLRGKPITSHIAGVYEVDAEGKITAWRDYLDSRELSVQLGTDERGADWRLKHTPLLGTEVTRQGEPRLWTADPIASACHDASMTAPSMNGLGHLDLTVTDGDRSVRWWEEVMGFSLLAKWEHADYHGWTMVHPSGMAVTVMTHDEGEAGVFDERRVGLDHVAFHVGDLTTLELWAAHLDALGVHHSGVQNIQGERGGPLIVLRDPDNIQLELTAGWQPRM